MSRFLFELVGPDYELAKAEILGAMEGLSFHGEILHTEEGILALETDRPIQKLFSRLGLTRRIHHLMGVTSGSSYDFSDIISYDLPEGSVAVRTKRIKGHRGDTTKIKERLGDLISNTNPIDLEEPDHEIFVLVSKDLFIGKKVYEFDRKKMRGRDVKNRPYFSPVSLKPRFTRALINLARPAENSKLHDPFCGTGGVLIEGYEMGLRVTGGDKDPDMINGCRTNLKKFDVTADLEVGDVSQTIPEGIDLVVTDPPYGRASSTSNEELFPIYERLFKTSKDRLIKGGHLAAIFPEERYILLGEEYLELLETHKIKVHGSLDRYFTAFRKPIC